MSWYLVFLLTRVLSIFGIQLSGKISCQYSVDLSLSLHPQPYEDWIEKEAGLHFIQVISRVIDCLVGLVVASTTSEQAVLGSIPGSDKCYWVFPTGISQ